MHTSAPTAHFWISQLGSHEWLVKRAMLPAWEASIACRQDTVGSSFVSMRITRKRGRSIVVVKAPGLLRL